MTRVGPRGAASPVAARSIPSTAQRAAFPLGGIGAGTVSLGARGASGTGSCRTGVLSDQLLGQFHVRLFGFGELLDQHNLRSDLTLVRGRRRRGRAAIGQVAPRRASVSPDHLVRRGVTKHVAHRRHGCGPRLAQEHVAWRRRTRWRLNSSAVATPGTPSTSSGRSAAARGHRLALEQDRMRQTLRLLTGQLDAAARAGRLQYDAPCGRSRSTPWAIIRDLSTGGGWGASPLSLTAWS